MICSIISYIQICSNPRIIQSVARRCPKYSATNIALIDLRVCRPGSLREHYNGIVQVYSSSQKGTHFAAFALSLIQSNIRSTSENARTSSATGSLWVCGSMMCNGGMNVISRNACTMFICNMGIYVVCKITFHLRMPRTRKAQTTPMRTQARATTQRREYVAYLCCCCCNKFTTSMRVKRTTRSPYLRTGGWGYTSLLACARRSNAHRFGQAVPKHWYICMYIYFYVTFPIPKTMKRIWSTSQRRWWFRRCPKQYSPGSQNLKDMYACMHAWYTQTPTQRVTIISIGWGLHIIHTFIRIGIPTNTRSCQRARAAIVRAFAPCACQAQPAYWRLGGARSGGSDSENHSFAEILKVKVVSSIAYNLRSVPIVSVSSLSCRRCPSFFVRLISSLSFVQRCVVHRHSSSVSCRFSCMCRFYAVLFFSVIA